MPSPYISSPTPEEETPQPDTAPAETARRPPADSAASTPEADPPNPAISQPAETPSTPKRNKGKSVRKPQTPAERRAKYRERQDKFRNPKPPKRIPPQRDAGDTARQGIKDAEHLKIVRKYGQKTNRDHHAIGCK